MKSNAHYFRIGLFFILMLALLIGGLILISEDMFGGERFYIETYLNESVQGLSQGTALLHRGVAIGRIEKITFVTREYPLEFDTPDYDKFSRYVMIVMSVDAKNFKRPDTVIQDVEATIRNQINNGLRLKLSYQGITGIALIEADYLDPARYPRLEVPWKPHNIYIPSAPSLITSFTQAVDTVFQRLDKVDFPALFTQFENTLKSVQNAVEEAKLGELRVSAVEMLNQFESTLKQAHAMMDTGDPNSPVSDIATTMAQLDRNLKQIEQLVSTHQDDIDTILTDMKTLTRNLKQLSEQIKADPAQLLLSSPPRKMENTK
ncbi:MAG TPA: hypothetical protein PKB02_09335 [Anaerohalosphaeraceae bacterium]|nr:hypothetical protein [Anaerohalosphaeraceae bacterium]